MEKIKNDVSAAIPRAYRRLVNRAASALVQQHAGFTGGQSVADWANGLGFDAAALIADVDLTVTPRTSAAAGN